MHLIVTPALFITGCPSIHGCSDRCIPTIQGYVCGCETGRILSADQKTCKAANSGDGWMETQPWRCEPQCDSNRNLVCSQLLSSLQFQCQCKAGYTPVGDSCEGKILKTISFL